MVIMHDFAGMCDSRSIAARKKAKSVPKTASLLCIQVVRSPLAKVPPGGSKPESGQECQQGVDYQGYRRQNWALVLCRLSRRGQFLVDTGVISETKTCIAIVIASSGLTQDGPRKLQGRHRAAVKRNLWTRSRPGVIGPLEVVEVAVVAGVVIAPFRPLGKIAVNRAAVRPSWGASKCNENHQDQRYHDGGKDSECLVVGLGPSHRRGIQ